MRGSGAWERRLYIPGSGIGGAGYCQVVDEAGDGENHEHNPEKRLETACSLPFAWSGLYEKYARDMPLAERDLPVIITHYYGNQAYTAVHDRLAGVSRWICSS